MALDQRTTFRLVAYSYSCKTVVELSLSQSYYLGLQNRFQPRQTGTFTKPKSELDLRLYFGHLERTI